MLSFASYLTQRAGWPRSGRHILAQYDDASIVVYQAFRPAIAAEAARLRHFGPLFSRSRMSWIKPNFLWMMFRCGWATKPDQERVLAIKLRRPFFEELLANAVQSSFVPSLHGTRSTWQDAVSRSDVRLQWDPDHDPSGAPVERRAIQLGLRGRTLQEYAEAAIIDLEDITDFVAEQRGHSHAPFTNLLMPAERALTPAMPGASENVGLDARPDELGDT